MSVRSPLYTRNHRRERNSHCKKGNGRWAKRKTLTKRSRNLVVTEDNEERLAHAKSLVVQGQLHHLDDTDGTSLWSYVVQTLPPKCMKFALNAAQDTLPHNANLAVWRRKAGLSDQCKLCNHRHTLLHVLNHCQVALDLRRYNQRHDSILKVIVESLKNRCHPDYKITVDLPHTNYNFPSTAASTDLRPDLAVWSDSERVLVLAELTVCFEKTLKMPLRGRSTSIWTCWRPAKAVAIPPT